MRSVPVNCDEWLYSHGRQRWEMDTVGSAFSFCIRVSKTRKKWCGILLSRRIGIDDSSANLSCIHQCFASPARAAGVLLGFFGDVVCHDYKLPLILHLYGLPHIQVSFDDRVTVLGIFVRPERAFPRIPAFPTIAFYPEMPRLHPWTPAPRKC